MEKYEILKKNIKEYIKYSENDTEHDKGSDLLRIFDLARNNTPNLVKDIDFNTKELIFKAPTSISEDSYTEILRVLYVTEAVFYIKSQIKKDEIRFKL